MAEHALVGPSSLARVIRCPGSVRETRGLPRKPKIYAAEGSVLHLIAAECLLTDSEPDEFFGRVIEYDGFTFRIGQGEGEVDPMCMQPALDWIREQPGERWVETRVFLDRWMPGQFGTCDLAIWDAETRTLTVLDWKFGYGVKVPTEGNEQARAYAIGFIETILKPLGIVPETVKIIIEQPRGSGGERYYRPWAISYDELMSFGDVLVDTWAAVNDPDAPLAAGLKQCAFCEAKERAPKPGDLTGCSVFDAFNLSFFEAELNDLDDLDFSMPENLTPARRAAIVEHTPMIEKWIEQIHAASKAAAEDGEPDPGTKLVAGPRGDRKWGDWMDQLVVEAKVARLMADQGFNRKVKSPAQIEKIVSTRKGKAAFPGLWALLEPWISRADGKPELVPASDPRPPLSDLAAELRDLDDL